MTSEGTRLIRAAYTDETITVYQAYAPQVGLSGVAVEHYLDEWIVAIGDVTALAHRVQELVGSGQAGLAESQVPAERVYPVAPALARWIGVDTTPELEGAP
jgi:hypothetical protein